MIATNLSCIGAKTLHRLIRKSLGTVDVVFKSIVLYVLIQLDNPINGEGVGYLFTAKYWERFIIESVLFDFDIRIDNTFDITYMLFIKYFPSHSPVLHDLKILRMIIETPSFQGITFHLQQ